MDVILSLLGAFLLFGLTIALYAGISALIAYILMLLWNFVVVSMGAANLQLSFYVAWAIWFLITIVAGPFRGRSSSR